MQSSQDQKKTFRSRSFFGIPRWNNYIYSLSGVLLQWFPPFRRYQVLGTENIPPPGQTLIVVANHVGESDPWLVGSILFRYRHRVCWFTYHVMFDYILMRKYLQAREEKLAGWIGRALAGYTAAFVARFMMYIITHSDAIPVDPDNSANPLNQVCRFEAKKSFEEGKCIGIFPQGGINRAQINPGYLTLARRYNQPILVVHIDKENVQVRIYPLLNTGDLKQHTPLSLEAHFLSE